MAELSNLRRRAKRILAKLQQEYGDADCALVHDSAWQLLIATILSAQSTDETVNQVTKVLFKRYPGPRELAAAPIPEIESVVRPSGFFRQKAKNIKQTSIDLIERFSGEVPRTIEELITLPGVARKTANVVLGTWFGINEGVVVDTHVGRIAERLELTWTSKNSKDAIRIERDLMEVIPQAQWTYLSHALIWHGRRVCRARKPDCTGCNLKRMCPSAGIQT